MPRPYATVPAEGESTSTLSSILDSREHWWISRYVQALQRIPPVTGLYLMSSSVTALLAWLINDNYPLDVLQYDLNAIKRGEIWRLATPFLYFGQLWLAHLFMAQSVALYMSSVEIAHCARPEKFVEFMLFGMTFLSAYGLAESLSGRGDMTMNSAAYHLHMYVLYYWSRLNEGSVVNCLDLFTLPAETVPAIFLLQNYLLYREFYVSDIAAIGAGYLYFYFFSDTPAVWPLHLLKRGSFKGLYQRFNNEIPR
ncbi:putative Der1-like family [Babesia divergens]|uniref:Derlin n=1 Tax=Babesia divergens TaxID=32595 RepID=A0AAD9GF23_BABDI|nr:putative Der1-like family [Babesia divergens]